MRKIVITTALAVALVAGGATGAIAAPKGGPKAPEPTEPGLVYEVPPAGEEEVISTDPVTTLRLKSSGGRVATPEKWA